MQSIDDDEPELAQVLAQEPIPGIPAVLPAPTTAPSVLLLAEDSLADLERALEEGNPEAAGLAIAGLCEARSHLPPHPTIAGPLAAAIRLLLLPADSPDAEPREDQDQDPDQDQRPNPKTPRLGRSPRALALLRQPSLLPDLRLLTSIIIAARQDPAPSLLIKAWGEVAAACVLRAPPAPRQRQGRPYVPPRPAPTPCWLLEIAPVLPDLFTYLRRLERLEDSFPFIERLPKDSVVRLGAAVAACSGALALLEARAEAEAGARRRERDRRLGIGVVGGRGSKKGSGAHDESEEEADEGPGPSRGAGAAAASDSLWAPWGQGGMGQASGDGYGSDAELELEGREVEGAWLLGTRTADSGPGSAPEAAAAGAAAAAGQAGQGGSGRCSERAWSIAASLVRGAGLDTEGGHTAAAFEAMLGVVNDYGLASWLESEGGRGEVGGGEGEGGAVLALSRSLWRFLFLFRTVRESDSFRAATIATLAAAMPRCLAGATGKGGGGGAGSGSGPWAQLPQALSLAQAQAAGGHPARRTPLAVLLSVLLQPEHCDCVCCAALLPVLTRADGKIYKKDTSAALRNLVACHTVLPSPPQGLLRALACLLGPDLGMPVDIRAEALEGLRTATTVLATMGSGRPGQAQAAVKGQARGAVPGASQAKRRGREGPGEDAEGGAIDVPSSPDSIEVVSDGMDSDGGLELGGRPSRAKAKGKGAPEPNHRGGDGGAQAAAMARERWPSEATLAVRTAAESDPSSRIRRGAASCLGAMLGAGVLPPGSEDEYFAVKALLARCQDRDAGVRRDALTHVAQLPIGLAMEIAEPAEWRALFSVCLVDPEQAVAAPAADLLEAYLASGFDQPWTLLAELEVFSGAGAAAVPETLPPVQLGTGPGAMYVGAGVVPGAAQQPQGGPGGGGGRFGQGFAVMPWGQGRGRGRGGRGQPSPAAALAQAQAQHRAAAAAGNAAKEALASAVLQVLSRSVHGGHFDGLQRWMQKKQKQKG